MFWVICEERTPSAGRTKTSSSTWLRKAESDLSLIDKILKSHMLSPHRPCAEDETERIQLQIFSWFMASNVLSNALGHLRTNHTFKRRSHQFKTQVTKSKAKSWITVLDTTPSTANTTQSHLNIYIRPNYNRQKYYISVFTFYLTTVDRSITPQYLHTT